MSTTIGQAWGELLPDDHRDALDAAMTMLYDMTFDQYADDIDFNESLLALWLPRRYAHRYDWQFGKRFLATVLTVGWKLAQRERPRPVLSSCAEELALHVLIEVACAAAELEGVPTDFGAFEDEVFEDLDFMRLYEPASAEMDDSDFGRAPRGGSLRFDDWFRSYPDVTWTPHPYGAAQLDTDRTL